MKPSKEITKLLISTTSSIVGEYEDEGILITNARPGKVRAPEWIGTTENPFSRNFFVVSIKTPEWKRNTVRVPDYSYLGDEFCIALSVLFGKRFDGHGLLEQHGGSYVPWTSNIPPSCSTVLAYNDHSKRIDFGIPLDLSEFKRIASLFYVSSIPRDALLSVGRFYLQAIQEYENQPEIAFLSLITSGEILSNFFDIPVAELLDQQSKNDIENIRANLQDGEKVANRFVSRLYQVKARYTRSILSLLDDQFFSQTQAPNTASSLRRDGIEKRIKASYDLRSHYVHAGKDFRDLLKHSIYYKEEIHLGRSVVEDQELRKILDLCPTFAGMERIVRYCLLNFLNEKGVSIR